MSLNPERSSSAAPILKKPMKTTTDEAAVVLKRFGDEQSTLLDRFERLSFEVHLNQAILGRSLSEPGSGSARPPCHAPLRSNLHKKIKNAVAVAPPQQGHGHGRRGSSFSRVLKRLLKPILRRKGGGGGSRSNGVPDSIAPHQHCMYSKAFSRSMRV